MRRTVAFSALLFAAGLMALPASAFAQAKKKSFLPAAQPKVSGPAAKKTDERKGPMLGGEHFVRQKTRQLAESKWKDAFQILMKLIKNTPNSDPSKPDLLYRLSEMYWERASAITLQAYDREEKCLEAVKRDGDEDICIDKRNAQLDKSGNLRDQAIKVYKHIVKNHPRYPRLDQVLFALGFNYQRKDNPEAAKKIYATLIRRYPQSIQVPNTLLNFGEILFEDGKVDQALKAYRKVVKNYKDSDVYGYALYKLAWCQYNIGQFKSALRGFIGVLDYSRKKRGGRNRLTLEREALRDMVRTYADIPDAKPAKAISFFRKVSPDNYLDVAEKLADRYSATGQFGKSNQLYRRLIKVQTKSYRVVSFQTAIAANTRNIGEQVGAVKELKRLVSLWRTVKDAKDAEPKRVKKDRARIDELLRTMAITYHRQADKTNSDEDYAIAYQLYGDYVRTFPNSDDAYMMTFYFAELLYKLKKWKEAAQTFEKVVEMQPDGEHIKDAAHGSVLAYQRLLEIKQSSRGTKPDDLVSAEIPAAKPIPEDYKRFLKACDVYSKYVEASQHLVDIEYNAARVYYDFNQFSEAIPRFKNIAEKHREHRLAIIAANLLLDTYNLKKDFDAMNTQVETFLRLYTRNQDPDFYALLIKLRQQATFKKCTGIEASKRWIEAAKCFRRYAKDSPNSKSLDKALYNAALNYEREKQIDQAIKMRMALVNNVSDSDLVPKALFQIAGNLHALATYSKASDAYEAYASAFPKKPEAKDALQNAAVFREGLGQLDRAISNYQAYIKLVGKKDRKKAAKIFFQIGGIYQKRSDWPKVIKHYRKFLKVYNKSAKLDLVLAAHTRIGNAYFKQAEPYLPPRSKRKRIDWGSFDKFNKPAQKAYLKAYKTFLGLSDAEKKTLTGGRHAVAEARFMMGESVYIDIRYRTRLKAKSYRNLNKFIKTMVDKILERSLAVAAGEKIYAEVIKLRSPNWAIAALGRTGQLYQLLSDDVYNYPAPKAFDEEQVEVFKGKMSDQSDVFRSKAISGYVACLKVAQQYKWFNPWTKAAETQLAELDPGKYRSNAEMRTRADHFSRSGVRQDFIAELPKEEELK